MNISSQTPVREDTDSVVSSFVLRCSHSTLVDIASNFDRSNIWQIQFDCHCLRNDSVTVEALWQATQTFSPYNR